MNDILRAAADRAGVFGGLTIHEVEPGTEIAGPGGETLVVTETQAVKLGSSMYLTPSQVAALRSHPDVRPK